MIYRDRRHKELFERELRLHPEGDKVMEAVPFC